MTIIPKEVLIDSSRPKSIFRSSHKSVNTSLVNLHKFFKLRVCRIAASDKQAVMYPQDIQKAISIRPRYS